MKAINILIQTARSQLLGYRNVNSFITMVLDKFDKKLMKATIEAMILKSSIKALAK